MQNSYYIGKVILNSDEFLDHTPYRKLNKS